MDPLAEEYISWTPFNYVLNNPIRFIDPDGMRVGSPNHSGTPAQVTNTGYVSAQSSLFIPDNSRNLRDLRIEHNNSQQTVYLPSQGTIRPNGYEQYYRKVTPEWTQQWIERDPTIRATAVGGLAVMTAVSAPIVKAGLIKAGTNAVGQVMRIGEASYRVYVTSNGQLGFELVTGAVFGAISNTLNLPPSTTPSDSPAFNFSAGGMDMLLQAIQNFIQQNTQQDDRARQEQNDEKDQETER